MTDEELVKMARLAQRDDRMSTGALYGDLADRIEALTAEPHAEGEAWGILNPYGRLWTHNTFPSEDAARRHVEAFWRGNPNAGDYVRGLKPVRVNVRVTLAEIEGEKG
jgi:hypothetical protein